MFSKISCKDQFSFAYFSKSICLVKIPSHTFNESTGVILGTPTRIQESTSHEIKFSCTLKEIPLEGLTEINIQINGPQSIVCSQIEDES